MSRNGTKRGIFAAHRFGRYQSEADIHNRVASTSSSRLPSRPGEFHPEPLTDPDLTLSRHPARAIARRLPPSLEHRVPPAVGSPQHQLTPATRRRPPPFP